MCQSLLDRYLGWYHLLAVVNGAEMSVDMHVSLGDMDFISFAHILSSRTAGS